MKKVVVTLLVAVMVVALFACTPSKPAASESPSAEATESASEAPSESASEAPSESAGAGASDLASLKTDFEIATVPKGTGIPWFQRMDVGVKKFAEDTGVNAYQIGPAEADGALQAQTIEDLIAKKVDAICVVPFSTESLEPVLQRAREAGILVIAHEAETMKNIDYDIEAFDNDAYGEHFMQKLSSLMGEKGEYALMVGSLTSASHNQWVDASKAYQEANFPDMKQAGDKVESNDDQNQAYEKIKEMLKAYPELGGIQGSAMADPAGAAKAVDEAGKAGKVKIVGTSLVSVSGKYIEEGVIDMISFWDPADAGYAMNELALRILNEQKVEEGMALTVPGYEKLILTENENGVPVLKGQAWIDVDKTNVKDEKYQF